MNVTPLAFPSLKAVRETLLVHGWDDARAEAASGGLGPVALHLTDIPEAALQALVHHAGKLGLDVFTGDGWAVLSGSRARVSALARPWVVPPELAELAAAVGLALPPDAPREWVTARGALPLDRPVILGILNITPDSFSDGGRHAALDAALAHADRLLTEGADLIDVGGESTRPDSTGPVPLEEELRRVVPVIEAILRRHPEARVSVDTVKSAVARAALAAGAAAVNDVSGFRLDREMAGVAAAAGAGVILMHSRGSVTQMATYEFATYGPDPVAEVAGELREAVARAEDGGVTGARIVVDPGFGFAKTIEQNILLFDRLAALLVLGRPLLVGPSRKRFLGVIAGRDVTDRDRATATACVLAWERGARLFRVHDVATTREALAVAHAIGGA